ncbi:hypothetical protein MRX96_038268 [Rhipicephalus microplus]
MLITSVTKVLLAVNPSPADMQVILEELQDKDVTLADFNDMVADLIIDDAKYGEESMAALQYNDKIHNIMSRFTSFLTQLKGPLTAMHLSSLL